MEIKKDLNEYYYQKNDLIWYSFILLYIFFFCSVLYSIFYFDSIFIKLFFVILLWFFQAGFNQWKHEFLHNTAIKNKYFNILFWYFFSIPIFVNPHLNKDFHLWHHKFLWTENDPELSFKVRQWYSFRDVMLDKLKNPFLLDLLVVNFKALFLNSFPKFVNDKNKFYIKIDSIILFLFHIIFILLSVYYWYILYLLTWYIVLEFIGFNILCVFDIAEHRGCNISDFYNDSRTVKSNFFITFISWFNNYHSVHHTDTLEKSVIFYKRKKFFDNVNQFQTTQVENSYIWFLKKLRKNPEKYIN